MKLGIESLFLSDEEFNEALDVILKTYFKILDPMIDIMDIRSSITDENQEEKIKEIKIKASNLTADMINVIFPKNLEVHRKLFNARNGLSINLSDIITSLSEEEKLKIKKMIYLLSEYPNTEE